MSTYFLKSPGCRNIKELVVNKHAFEQSVPLDFIDLFDSYPLLTSLSIHDITIPLHKLKCLHNAAPALESLVLTFVKVPDTEALPTTIMPAAPLKVLHMIMKEVAVDTEIKYLVYAAKKYPNITELAYYNSNDQGVESFDRICEQGLMPFIQPIASQLKKQDVVVPRTPAALADILHQIKLKQKPYQIDFTNEGADDELKKLVDFQQARTLEDLEIIFDQEKLDFTPILKEFVSLKRL
jgi:hypothetical protein